MRTAHHCSGRTAVIIAGASGAGLLVLVGAIYVWRRMRSDSRSPLLWLTAAHMVNRIALHSAATRIPVAAAVLQRNEWALGLLGGWPFDRWVWIRHEQSRIPFGLVGPKQS